MRRARDAVSPPVRLAGSVFLIASVALATPSLVLPTIAALTVVLVLLFERPPARRLLVRALMAAAMIGLLVLPIALGREAAHAWQLALRAGSATLVALSLSTLWRAHEVGPALATLRSPAALVEVIGHLARQLGSIAEDGRRLMLARRLRGGSAAVGVEVVSTLLIRTALRAERTSLAAELRAGGKLRPIHRPRRGDAWFIAGSSAFAVLAQAGRLLSP